MTTAPGGRRFTGLKLDHDDHDAAVELARGQGSDKSTVLRRWVTLGRAAESHGAVPGAPSPAQTPETGSQRVSVDISGPALAYVDSLADSAGTDREAMLRRMLTYAARNMPRGWTPPTKTVKR